MKRKKDKVTQEKGETRNQEARLCVDYSEKDSFQAIQILRNAGYKVSAAPTSGLAEPELSYGSHNYNGISEIREFVKNNKTK